ncbi:MAG: DUF5050 domain-containing protein [Candidatus Moranbacteria bacterium]|jgi:hypothetical protein|nr:DUF5050 domain-containing protein [Candidatus Moranbacteria bacterium]
MTSLRARRIFFWILVVFFLVTAPLMILYTIGYRYNTGRGIFVYSGSVTVKSIPQRVNIKIDTDDASERKFNFLNYSYHLDGIRPGEHSIEISLPGYHTWTKKTSVHSGLSAEFWNVFLVKNEYIKETFSSPSVDDFFISPKNKEIALVQNKKDTNDFIVRILDTNKDLAETAFSSSEYSFSKDKRENVEWSPQGDKIIIPVEKLDLTAGASPVSKKVVADSQKVGQPNYFIVDINSKESINLEDFSQKKNLQKVRWDPNSKNFIFYLSENNLYRIDLNDPANNKLIAENIYGYDLSNSSVYYLKRDNNIIYRSRLQDGESVEQITNQSINNVDGNGDFRMIVYDEDRISIVTNGKLYIYNNGEHENYFYQLKENIDGAQFSNDGKKLLFWDENEIFVYFTRDWDTQPIRLENEVKSITRFSKKIKNVHWFSDYEHIIFSIEGTVKIAETDLRDRLNIEDILQLKNNDPKIVFNFSEDFLYFNDFQESDISQLSYINLLEE